MIELRVMRTHSKWSSGNMCVRPEWWSSCCCSFKFDYDACEMQGYVSYVPIPPACTVLALVRIGVCTVLALVRIGVCTTLALGRVFLYFGQLFVNLDLGVSKCTTC